MHEEITVWTKIGLVFMGVTSVAMLICIAWMMTW